MKTIWSEKIAMLFANLYIYTDVESSINLFFDLFISSIKLLCSGICIWLRSMKLIFNLLIEGSSNNQVSHCNIIR